MLENTEIEKNKRTALQYAVEEKEFLHQVIEDTEFIIDILLKKKEDAIATIKSGKFDQKFEKYLKSLDKVLKREAEK